MTPERQPPRACDVVRVTRSVLLLGLMLATKPLGVYAQASEEPAGYRAAIDEAVQQPAGFSSINPVEAPDLMDVVDVSVGGFHACAVTRSGSVYCWGFSDRGQLGNGTLSNLMTPTRVSGLPPTVAVSAGHFHTCALLADRTVACWGGNSAGELGDGTKVQSATPVAARDVRNAVGLYAGSSFSCALLVDRALSCWGNVFGTDPPASQPTPTGVTNVVRLGAGSARYACLIGGSSQVECWGESYKSRLGVVSEMTLGPKAPSVVSDTAANFVEVASGENHSCARRGSGQVACWGDNNDGQLGTLAEGPLATPVAVEGL